MVQGWRNLIWVFHFRRLRTAENFASGGARVRTLCPAGRAGSLVVRPAIAFQATEESGVDGDDTPYAVTMVPIADRCQTIVSAAPNTPTPLVCLVYARILPLARGTQLGLAANIPPRHRNGTNSRRARVSSM